jgi:DNA-binding transcriptional LysR family regulator
LTRTTRAVVLTEAGSEYLTRVEPLLDALEEANQAARGTGELRGVLRLALPTSIAAREISTIARTEADTAPTRTGTRGFSLDTSTHASVDKKARLSNAPMAGVVAQQHLLDRQELGRSSPFQLTSCC